MATDPSHHLERSRFRLEVRFGVEPVVIEVEGTSLKDVWERRYEIAEQAAPVAWEVHPRSVESVNE